MSIYKQINKYLKKENVLFSMSISYKKKHLEVFNLEDATLEQLDCYIRITEAEKALRSQSHAATTLSSMAVIVSISVAFLNFSTATLRFESYMFYYFLGILVALLILSSLELYRIYRFRTVTYFLEYLYQLRMKKFTKI